MEQNTPILWPKRSENQNELITALCNAQAEMPIIDKNKSGRFKYADFPQVIHMTRPVLTKHGLVVTQDFIAAQQGINFLLTTLAHISGQWRESIYALPQRSLDVTDKGQSFNALCGGDITYYKRYAYCAIIGCATSDEDYDGDPIPESKPRYNVTISPAQLGLLLKEIGSDNQLITAILKKEAIYDLKDMAKERFNVWLEKVRQLKEMKTPVLSTT